MAHQEHANNNGPVHMSGPVHMNGYTGPQSEMQGVDMGDRTWTPRDGGGKGETGGGEEEGGGTKK